MRFLIVAALLLVSQLGFAKSLQVVKSTGTPKNVIEESMSKVVMIEVHGIIEDYESIFSTYTKRMDVTWYGSGSLISADGMILSCDHLFERKLEDRRIIIKTNTGKGYLALLLSENHKKDLSVLKIFSMKKLPYFEFGQTLKRGDKVLAFGAPLGLRKTVSIGYVENIDVGPESIKATLHGAALNPGNSGGPLVNEDGKLVGVNVSHLMVNFLQRAEVMNIAVSVKDIKTYLQE